MNRGGRYDKIEDPDFIAIFKHLETITLFIEETTIDGIVLEICHCFHVKKVHLECF